MIVSIKRLSRAFVPLAVFVCALVASNTLAQQRREQRPARPTSQARAATPSQQPASQSSPQLPTPPPQPASQSPSQASQVSEDEADLAITANVTAQSLRFDAVPNVTVEFPGRPRRETAWEAERTNLPRPVQPGVTYRDVGVRLKIVSVFADIDRIVAEALGEVPPSDDGAQPNASPPNATPQANDAPATERAAASDAAMTHEPTAANEAATTNDATATNDTRQRTPTNDPRTRASASRRARPQPSRRLR